MRRGGLRGGFIKPNASPLRLRVNYGGHLVFPLLKTYLPPPHKWYRTIPLRVLRGLALRRIFPTLMGNLRPRVALRFHPFAIPDFYVSGAGAKVSHRNPQFAKLPYRNSETTHQIYMLKTC